jgi:hypothetical protein
MGGVGTTGCGSDIDCCQDGITPLYCLPNPELGGIQQCTAYVPPECGVLGSPCLAKSDCCTTPSELGCVAPSCAACKQKGEAAASQEECCDGTTYFNGYCRVQSGYCSSPNECMSNQCNEDLGVCRADCSEAGGFCGGGSACCPGYNYNCTDGICIVGPPQCFELGEDCDTGQFPNGGCCEGQGLECLYSLPNWTCQQAVLCAPRGISCTDDAECCTGDCGFDLEGAGTCICRVPGDYCNESSDCCVGTCTDDGVCGAWSPDWCCSGDPEWGCYSDAECLNVCGDCPAGQGNYNYLCTVWGSGTCVG